MFSLGCVTGRLRLPIPFGSGTVFNTFPEVQVASLVPALPRVKSLINGAAAYQLNGAFEMIRVDAISHSSVPKGVEL